MFHLKLLVVTFLIAVRKIRDTNLVIISLMITFSFVRPRSAVMTAVKTTKRKRESVTKAKESGANITSITKRLSNAISKRRNWKSAVHIPRTRV